MRIRLQLFEFEDLAWFPVVVRAGMMDYLRFMITHLHTYRPIVPLLAEGMRRTQQTQVLELCAGAGGGAEDVLAALHAAGMPAARIQLTDLYPQSAAWTHVRTQTQGAISFEPQAVDALQVPADLEGFRAVFSAFHHFPPSAAEALLRNAVEAGRGIGVFEGAAKHWLELVLACTVLPLAQLCITPFIRPFRLSRLVFTYLLPLIPLCTIWDGCVSILRMYPPEDLLALAHRADPTGRYQWQAGKVRHRWGPRVTYLIGWPQSVA
ncbi:class I SAM-dependent methyltransferase [Hymenobacter lutimineralis]|uniref:Class I SAM-dependent methyltransferase n=1 Tax=Hymenobacter lutimineralis TaxID=2606448 RepID=A0A5D6UVS0_9BACT|nr:MULTISPECIES: class I SAM-dependent methyltransferase [Hymenobacter]QIX60806.1 class I SAM-dependent methyltransferase [Hymenobacter sp. BT18]TYZ06762.1 class I SAM-dependent methyltransferase [Hymenobacter lutimineralis]